jgi:hypothetical protein
MARPGGEQFAKRARERAREERREEKRQRRETRAAESADPADGPSEDALMEEFRVLSERNAAGSITESHYAQERRRIFDELGIALDDQ